MTGSEVHETVEEMRESQGPACVLCENRPGGERLTRNTHGPRRLYYSRKTFLHADSLGTRLPEG
jgi:hypothetical protein